jgi:predicted outer membrane lipoprotein
MNDTWYPIDFLGQMFACSTGVLNAALIELSPTIVS